MPGTKDDASSATAADAAANIQRQLEKYTAATADAVANIQRRLEEQRDENTKNAATTWVTNTQDIAKNNLATRIAAENRWSFKQKLLFSTIIAFSILTPIVLTSVTAFFIAPQVSLFVGIASLASCLTLSISSYGALKFWKFWANDHTKEKKEFKEERASDFARESAEHKPRIQESNTEENGIVLASNESEEGQVVIVTQPAEDSGEDEVQQDSGKQDNDNIEEKSTESKCFAVKVIENIGTHPTDFDSNEQRHIYKNCMPEAIRLIAALHTGVLPYNDIHGEYRSYVEPDEDTAKECMAVLFSNKNNKYSKREFAKIFKRINRMEFRIYQKLPETILEYLDIMDSLKKHKENTLIDRRKKNVVSMINLLNNIGNNCFNINTFDADTDTDTDIATIRRQIKGLSAKQLHTLKTKDQECKTKFTKVCKETLNGNYTARYNDNAKNRSDFGYDDIKPRMGINYAVLYEIMDIKDLVIEKAEKHSKYTVIKPAKYTIIKPAEATKSIIKSIHGMFKHSEERPTKENDPLLGGAAVDAPDVELTDL